MRLAQLARKATVTPSEVREFIQQKFNIEIENDPNIKLETVHVEAALKAFNIVVEERERPPSKETEELPLAHDNHQSLTAATEVAEGEAALGALATEPSAEVSGEPASASARATSDQEHRHDTQQEIEKTAGQHSSLPAEENQNQSPSAVQVKRPILPKVVGKIELEKNQEAEKEEVKAPSRRQSEGKTSPERQSKTTFTNGVSRSDSEEVDLKEREAVFAELDAAMEDNLSKEASVPVPQADEKKEEEEDEYAIYKDEKGLYRFTSQQKKNRRESLLIRAERERVRQSKERKARHYQKNVAVKIKPAKKKRRPRRPEKREEALAVQADETAVKEGVWGRFLNWLNDR